MYILITGKSRLGCWYTLVKSDGGQTYTGGIIARSELENSLVGEGVWCWLSMGCGLSEGHKAIQSNLIIVNSYCSHISIYLFNKKIIIIAFI